MKALTALLAERRDRQRLDRFFARYHGRTLIVHRGLTVDWIDELLKLGGGGGHFRIDARQPHNPRSPVSWLTHRFLLPLTLPLPLFCDVGLEQIAVRHLLQRDRICHPADIAWIRDDMRVRHRVHATLTRHADRLVAHPGIDARDNAYEIDFNS